MMKETTTTEKIYTLKEISEILKVSPRTLYRHMASGKLEAVKMCGQWRVTQKALTKLMEGK